jgi:hypothetical protein
MNNPASAFLPATAFGRDRGRQEGIADEQGLSKILQ